MSLVSIGEHKFEIPDPKKKSDILFIDEKDPYWVRERMLVDYRDIWFDFVPGSKGTRLYQNATLYDSDGNLSTLNKEDSDWMIWAYEREFHRRTYGVHFKNGKKIEWLTGDHWFTLMWAKTKRPDKISDYFDFRYFQAEYFYLLWHVNNSPLIDGLFLSKPKKTGITNLHWIYYLNKATMTKNINLGNMNIDLIKGAKTFRDHFMYAFNGLPMALQPAIKSKSETDGIVVFGDRITNTSKKNKGAHTDQELNTTVMCVPTIANAFDVDVFEDIWYDEPPKLKSDFGEIYRSNSGATNIQGYQVGKKWMTSYTPEGEAPSFVSSKELYFNSELRTITEHSKGRTRSGLICHHIPAYKSWWTSFDKNGYCREMEAMQEITNKRNSIKGNVRELQTEIRRYANDKKEAWLTGGAGTIFDNLRLSDLLTDVEEVERSSVLPIGKRGRFEWKNKLWEVGLKNKRPKGVFGEVEFVPLTEQEMMDNAEAPVLMFDDLPDHLKNYALKQGRDEWGNLMPPLIFNNTLGADPTQHAAASEVIEGSKNAFICMSRHDERTDSIMRRIASKVIRFVYFDRPESPDEAYEDLLKMIIYTGSLSSVEANVPEFATRLMAEGLGNYMLVKDEDGLLTIWKRWMGLAHESDKKYHLLRTTANNQDSRERLETFVRLIKAYITKPEPGGKDYGPTIKDKRILKQLMDLDATDTKKFDLFMALGYCMLTDEVYSGLLLSGQRMNGGDSEIANVLAALMK